MTIAAYIITIIIFRSGILDLFTAPINIITVFILRLQVIAATISFFASFYLLNLLWLNFEGGSIPLILVLVMFIWNLTLAGSGLLTPEGLKQNYGESIALFLFFIYMLIFSNSIRWF